MTLDADRLVTEFRISCAYDRSYIKLRKGLEVTLLAKTGKSMEYPRTSMVFLTCDCKGSLGKEDCRD